MPSSRVTVGYSPDREPEPVPPYTGLVADQPKVFTLAPSPKGSSPSFFSRTKPSSAMSSHRALASWMLPSLMLPPPRRAMLTMPYSGPVRIISTMITRATTKAIQAEPRTRPFRGFWSLTAAMVTTTASTRTTARAIRCPWIRPSVTFTSSMLMPNIFLPPHSHFGGRFPPAEESVAHLSHLRRRIAQTAVFSAQSAFGIGRFAQQAPPRFVKSNNTGALFHFFSSGITRRISNHPS